MNASTTKRSVRFIVSMMSCRAWKRGAMSISSKEVVVDEAFNEDTLKRGL